MAATATAVIEIVRAIADIAIEIHEESVGRVKTRSVRPIENSRPPISDDIITPVSCDLIDDHESDDPTSLIVVTNVPINAAAPRPDVITDPQYNPFDIPPAGVTGAEAGVDVDILYPTFRYFIFGLFVGILYYGDDAFVFDAFIDGKIPVSTGSLTPNITTANRKSVAIVTHILAINFAASKLYSPISFLSLD